MLFVYFKSQPTQRVHVEHAFAVLKRTLEGQQLPLHVDLMLRTHLDHAQLTWMEVYTPTQNVNADAWDSFQNIIADLAKSAYQPEQNPGLGTRHVECFVKVNPWNHDDLLQAQSELRHDYARLGPKFVTPTPCTPLQHQARLVHLNEILAESLGLSPTVLNAPIGTAILSGNAPWPNYESMASVYCGHQFGVYVPQLGDGRALMLAEIGICKTNSASHEVTNAVSKPTYTPSYAQLQLKGAGQTPYSRMGDGRAVLRSSIREYLCSEAMHHLGIPTTRALSLAASSDPVFREETETAAVVCRVSESFLRFGHVEYFSFQEQFDELKTLLDWHLGKHHPVFSEVFDAEQRHAQWFTWVVKATAKMVALWQTVGFCHGVMNTDNMSLLGLTLDYGPFGFMDAFDMHHVCNHSDAQGRYSYANQPAVARWNLQVLAVALKPVVGNSALLENALDAFSETFTETHHGVFAAKLGVFQPMPVAVIEPFLFNTLRFLHDKQIDFTRFFRSLSALHPELEINTLWHQWQSSAFFAIPTESEATVALAKTWLGQWLAWHKECRTQASSPKQEPFDVDAWQTRMCNTNPAFVLRNHLLQQAIQNAQRGDFAMVEGLFKAAQSPFTEDHPVDWLAKPPDWASHLVLSCSS